MMNVGNQMYSGMNVRKQNVGFTGKEKTVQVMKSTIYKELNGIQGKMFDKAYEAMGKHTGITDKVEQSSGRLLITL